MNPLSGKSNFIWFMVKVIVITSFFAIPLIYFVYIKNLSMNEGRIIKSLENEIIVLKKKNSNLENILSKKINFSDIEIKAKRKLKLKYIHENNNRIIMVKE